MAKLTKRLVRNDYFDYELVENATIIRIVMNRARGSLVIKSKGNYADESWDKCLQLSCDRLSRAGMKGFAAYATSVIGVEFWSLIENDVPND